jgi:hypothetical protein
LLFNCPQTSPGHFTELDRCCPFIPQLRWLWTNSTICLSTFKGSCWAPNSGSSGTSRKTITQVLEEPATTYLHHTKQWSAEGRLHVPGEKARIVSVFTLKLEKKIRILFILVFYLPLLPCPYNVGILITCNMHHANNK